MNRTYSTCSDETLLKSMGDNDDERAFAELYNRYFRSLFNYAYSKVNDQFIAQEIIQELFVSVWQQRDRPPVQCTRSFLFSCVKNRVISYYRKELTRRYHYNRWETQTDDSNALTDQQILTSDLQHQYEKGLHQLPPKCREVFLLSRKGLSNREIALQLTISEKTVEQHITKALRVLKAYLKEHFVYLFLLFPIF
ncbi:RNA polymerase sigma-70 factor [Larkinella humicola]|uniref:RNA polymerase sigma-70 factor n=1 Tax=Larkinella humicola TaxID=2607654 RepID=A0A5N1JAC5_9BACT|nr:RNA polymerase sigma-70 factor [Larkinella humicola]KAA9349421.1 RNA polymerase sigma-70 factor [Larkinella humicola]